MINELNTMPGLTEVSGYPKMWEASGLPFHSCSRSLFELAFERHQEKSLTKTSQIETLKNLVNPHVYFFGRDSLCACAPSDPHFCSFTSIARHFPSRF